MIQVAMLLLSIFMLLGGLLGLLVISPYAVQSILICAAVFNRLQTASSQSPPAGIKVALRFICITCNGMLIFWGIYDVITGISGTSLLDILFGLIVIAVGAFFVRAAYGVKPETPSS